MADNTILNLGSGGDTIATDDIGGVKHQLVKVEFGAADSVTQVSSAAPLPVVQTPADPVGGGTEAAAIRITLANDSTGLVSVDDNGGSITVDGTVGVSGDVTCIGKAADGAAVSGNPVLMAGQDGTNVQSIKTDTAGELQVDVLTLPALVAGTANIGDVDVLTLPALVAGTANIGDVDVLTLPALVAGTANIGDVDVLTMPNVTLAAGTNTNEVVGDVAHDVVAAGNPVLVAASAETMADSAPTNRVSADADATRLSATDGALYVIPTGPQTFSYHDDDVAAVTTDGTVHASPGAGLSLYITDIAFSIGVATASSIFLEESTTKVLGPYYLEAIAGRGLKLTFQTPKKITAATELLVTNTGATTFSVDVTGFIAPG